MLRSSPAKSTARSRGAIGVPKATLIGQQIGNDYDGLLGIDDQLRAVLQEFPHSSPSWVSIVAPVRGRYRVAAMKSVTVLT
jgi:hypothetical protein